LGLRWKEERRKERKAGRGKSGTGSGWAQGEKREGGK